MLKLESITKNALLSGIAAGQVARIVSADLKGDNALSVVYKTNDGRLGERVLFRTDEANLSLSFPPSGSSPPPTPGAWGPPQHAPRHDAPRMDAPRFPNEPNSRFRPPPSGEMRGEQGHDRGRGPENRFGGRQ